MGRIDRVIEYYNLPEDITKDELLIILVEKIDKLDQQISGCKKRKEQERLKKEHMRVKGFKSIVENHGISIPIYEEEVPRSIKRINRYYLRTRAPQVKAIIPEAKEDIKHDAAVKKEIEKTVNKTETLKPAKKKRISPIKKVKGTYQNLLSYFDSIIRGVVQLGQKSFTKSGALIFTVVFLFLYFQHHEQIMALIEESNSLLYYQLPLVGGLTLLAVFVSFVISKRQETTYEPLTVTMAGSIFIFGFLNFFSIGMMLLNQWQFSLDSVFVQLGFGLLINGILLISLYFAMTLAGLIHFSKKPQALKGYYSFCYLLIMYGMQQAQEFYNIFDSSFQFLIFIILGSYGILYYLDEPLLQITPYVPRINLLDTYKNPFRYIRRLLGRILKMPENKKDNSVGNMYLWGFIMLFILISTTLRANIRILLFTIDQLPDVEMLLLIGICVGLWLGRFHHKIPLSWDKLYNDAYGIILYLVTLYVLRGFFVFTPFGTNPWQLDLFYILLTVTTLLFIVNRNARGYWDIRMPIAAAVSILGRYAFYEYEIFEGLAYEFILTTMLPVILAMMIGRYMYRNMGRRAYQ